MKFKLKSFLGSYYKFYEKNLALIVLLVVSHFLIITTAAYIPYLNWFLDLLPVFLFIIDWVILLLLFRPSTQTIFNLFCLSLVITFLVTLLSLPQASAVSGVIDFGLITTVVIKKLIELRNETHNESE